MPQIAVKEKLVELIAEGGGGMPCNDARGLRFSTGGLHSRSGWLFTHHIQYTCLYSYLHRQPTTRMRIPWVQFHSAPNGRPRELRITHWFDELVCRHKQVKAPYRLQKHVENASLSPWIPAPSGGGEKSVPGAALPVQVFVLLP
ncbi:hypothetical protein CFAM422_004851 [Trichoderma lentiforme]|uniref:Uncharacterized protein n=1 Tax=Trichoderma lentiforme TaxID=1567552 RepID=A0A9P5CGF3_9HYPO|nr:hypothetical protein CFAM422_004851 [Trichoderma lentiforme]